jgi:hypothetical protein
MQLDGSKQQVDGSKQQDDLQLNLIEYMIELSQTIITFIDMK